MPDGLHDQRRRDTLIRMSIGELTAWHLMVTCDHCRVENPVMLRDLVARFGAERRLVSLVPRLRCKAPACGRPPSLVRLRSKFPIHPGPAMVDVMVHGRAKV